MSLTEKTYTRFWSSMNERYGTRWSSLYGDKATHAWREMLASFTPRDIERAMVLLSTREHTKEFPPTEPEFRALLAIAARAHSQKSDDPNELRRGYWRSTIVYAVADGMGYRQDPVGFEALLIAHKTLGVAMKDLLDDVDELECATGQRTPGQHDVVVRRAAEIAVAFRELMAAA